jgi:hypothetical protein
MRTARKAKARAVRRRKGRRLFFMVEWVAFGRNSKASVGLTNALGQVKKPVSGRGLFYSREISSSVDGILLRTN